MKPKQFFYVILGIIGVVVAAGGAGYYFALQKLQEQKLATSDLLAEQKTSGEEIERLERLKRQYDRDIEPILPMIEAALPRDKKQTEILTQLQKIAGEVGLSISSVSMPSPQGLPSSVSQTVKAGTLLVLPISFQLTGSYGQLQTSTARVENSNRFTNVTNLAISRPDKTKPLVYSISLNAYIKP